MPSSLSRADFCRLSLGGLLGAACQQKSSVDPTPKAAPAPVASTAADTTTAGAKTQASFKRKLGATGEMVSMLGLGGAHIGKKDKLSDDEAIKLMRDAVEGGITFFDNCWEYHR